MANRSITGNLKKLTTVKKGDDVRGVASSERINAIQEAIKALARGDNVVAGENLRKKLGEGFFVLSGNRAGRGGISEKPEAPFQLVQVNKLADDTSFGDLIGVTSNSHLFNSEDRDTYEEDNSDWGLLADDRPPGDPFAWQDNYLGDKIWLQIELDEDQVIIAIDVLHGPVGETGLWSTYPNPVEINNDDPGNVYQQFYHQIIAEVTDPEEDPRPGLIVKNDADQEIQITQCLFTDLMMTTAHTTRDATYPDVPLLVAVPWLLLPGTDTGGSADEINDVPDPGGSDDPITPWAFGPGSELAQTPFRVIPVPSVGDDQIGVISNSHVFNSESRDDYEELNDDWGLLSDDETLGAFTAPNIGEKIWLEIELDPEDQSIVSINVEWGAAWEGYPDPIGINTDDPNNPYQQYFRQIIAEVTDPEQDPRAGFVIGDPDAPRQITQLLAANLMMTTGHTTHDADQPDLPLLVAIPWSVLPGTDTGGNADEIPPEEDLMTPWQLGTVEAENHYDFELVNASDETGAKVLIYDGVVYTANNDPVDPDGMPSDNSYILDVADGDEIWAGFTYQENTFVITSCWLDNGPATPDDDPAELTAYVTIGHVAVDDSGDVPIARPINEVCGDIFWEPPQLKSYFDFQLEDASEQGAAMVLVYDGVVIGPNDEPIDPSGMPSGNSYQIPVDDGDEIWLGITWDMETDDSVSGDNIVSVWIDSGPATPDDDGLTQYITIGHAAVDVSQDIPVVTPFNELCGDAVIQYPPFLPNGNKLLLSVNQDSGNIVWADTEGC